VDGREALRVESETTGEGLHGRGIQMYHYGTRTNHIAQVDRP
jgi:hypothetical protein